MHNRIILELTENLLKSRTSSLLMCEGIDDGFFDTLTNLSRLYSSQCIELPCSENAAVGMCLGVSMCGCLPILCFQRVEFALLALEQLFNNVGPSLYFSDNKRSLTSLFRFVIGRGWGQGPTHSQTLESLFSLIPKVNLFLPCFPEDSEFLFSLFPEDIWPTISLEHRWIHFVESSGVKVRSKNPYLARMGKDLTIVASSYNVVLALRVAAIYQHHGIGLEVVNLHSLTPDSYDEITSSANRTGNLLFIDMSHPQTVSKTILASLILDSTLSRSVSIDIVGPKTTYSPASFRLVSDHYLTLYDLGKSINALLELPEYVSEKILTALRKVDLEFPVDKPNPSFSGPF